MNYIEYKKNVLIWRNSLIQAWAFSCVGTDSDCAYTLLAMARKLRLTDREKLSGGVMKVWPRKQIAPSWACSAALVLLISNKYLPNKDDILAAMVFYWLVDNKIKSVEDALENFPKYLKNGFHDRIEYLIYSFFKK